MTATAKILAIPATNSRSGLNEQLLDHAGAILSELHSNIVVETLDLNDFEMPIYSPERETTNGVPAEGQAFFSAIGKADAVMVSFAEYNGSFTPAWKNTYDWASRVDARVYQGKPVAMFAATPGPRAGAGVLGAATMSAPFFGAELVGSLGIGSFFESFDSEAKALTDDATAKDFRQILESLVAATMVS